MIKNFGKSLGSPQVLKSNTSNCDNLEISSEFRSKNPNVNQGGFSLKEELMYLDNEKTLQDAKEKIELLQKEKNNLEKLLTEEIEKNKILSLENEKLKEENKLLSQKKEIGENRKNE